MKTNDGEYEVSISELIENNRRWMKQRQMELARKEEAMEELNQECNLIRRDLELMGAWLESVSRKNLAVNGETSESNDNNEKDTGTRGWSGFGTAGSMDINHCLGTARGLSYEHEPFSGFASSRDVHREEGREVELRGDRLRNEVANILLEVYPQELYYREILQHLKERGYTVGGKDPGLNLIAHLAKDDRFQHGDKRGVYILSARYVNE